MNPSSLDEIQHSKVESDTIQKCRRRCGGIEDVEAEDVIQQYMDQYVDMSECMLFYRFDC
jgi:hypothetical protein